MEKSITLNMNKINTLSYSICLIIGLVLGLFLGYKGASKAIINVFNTHSVSGAINKPTQHTTTNNKVEISKLKVKNSDSLNFNFDYKTNQKPLFLVDSCEKAMIIYNKYINLSNSKKKRFDNW